jgi:hypothetical protein
MPPRGRGASAGDRAELQHFAQHDFAAGGIAVTKGPTGKEIMKRRTPDDLSLRPARFESDPKKAYTTEQLAEIGAIMLKWNQIEAHIEFIATFILFTKSPFWLRRSIGKTLTAKSQLNLLKECLKRATLLDNKITQCTSDCFAQIEQCRAYRNAIIHYHIYDHGKGIGSYVDESHSPYQILVSIDALTILYQILCSLLDELREIDLLFRIETDAQRPGQLDIATGEFHAFDDAKLKKDIIPHHVKRIMALQESRKEKKLPKFPDADLIRALNEQTDADPN